jgi:hypothetical protein
MESPNEFTLRSIFVARPSIILGSATPEGAGILACLLRSVGIPADRHSLSTYHFPIDLSSNEWQRDHRDLRCDIVRNSPPTSNWSNREKEEGNFRFQATHKEKEGGNFMKYEHDLEARSKEGGYSLPVNCLRCSEGCAHLQSNGVAAVDRALPLRSGRNLIKLSQ